MGFSQKLLTNFESYKEEKQFREINLCGKPAYCAQSSSDRQCRKVSYLPRFQLPPVAKLYDVYNKTKYNVYSLKLFHTKTP